MSTFDLVPDPKYLEEALKDSPTNSSRTKM